jgi:hypothetical protein
VPLLLLLLLQRNPIVRAAGNPTPHIQLRSQYCNNHCSSVLEKRHEESTGPNALR